MANNSVGCSSGKSLLVDPNKFDGQSSFTNMSVPLEDLSISVELTTSKKARTVLVSTQSGGNSVNEGKDTVTINFIDGVNVSGKKVLTTSYTDLTTSFDKNNDSESLGITNIDIDFNSSYAPQITITFIDVRGSAIFQNENNIGNNSNKYSVFFQLPYPIYQLTVKGYYGKPVKYCLHMTKFNSRFNSQTGNFEITASYIGYTYAMLTDMLIGYLKAIVLTGLGNDRLVEMQKNDSTLIPLHQLMRNINEINSIVDKIKADDPDQKEINDGGVKLSLLDVIKSNLNIFGTNLSTASTIVNTENIENFRYIAVPSTNSVSVNSSPGYKNTTDSDNPSTIQILTTYNNSVSENIKKYNEDVNPNFQLHENDFINLKIYKKITLQSLVSLSQDPTSNKALALKIPSDNLDKKRTDIFDFISKNYNFLPTTEIDVYDLTIPFEVVTEKTNDINLQIKLLTKKLGVTMKNKVSQALGFVPTIRNIIKIFCAHVEIFLGVIHDVSVAASKNDKRTSQLQSKFKNFDIHTTDTDNSGDVVGSLNSQYYPWPEYRKETDDGGLTETYLGNYGVLTNPKDVNELAFIDDLLVAFLKSAKFDSDLSNQIGEQVTNWYPINPIDTRLYVNKFPYKRIKGNTHTEVINLMVIRGMIYMGYTNKNLTSEEIQNMANLEADAVLSDISNTQIILALTQIKNEDFILAKGEINNNNSFILKHGGMTNLGDYYDYKYIIDSDFQDSLRILPISDNFGGVWDNTPSDLVERRDDGGVFLTNYSNSLNDKVDDGGVYVKIISSEDYSNSKPLISGPTVTTNLLMLDKLKQSPLPQDVGFNQFGGKYGIQEFSQLDYGNESLNGLPLSYVFYNDAINFGLSNSRSASGPDGKNNTTTSIYDIKSNEATYRVQNSLNGMSAKLAGPGEPLHKNYGKNRSLFNNYRTNSSTNNITYPYIEFGVKGAVNTNISLFGSRFYYEQSNSDYPKHAKALLFLHSLPWNGLVDTTLSNETTFGVFSNLEISNLFSNRAGFIEAPKLWVAFVGAILWRYDLVKNGSVDPILFKNSTESFIPTLDTSSVLPTNGQYLKVSNIVLNNMSMSFDSNSSYINIEDTLLNLPDQAKTEFKTAFFDFVSSEGVNSDWDQLSTQLELIDGSGTDLVTSYYNTINSIIIDNINDISVLNTSLTKQQFNSNFDNYIVVLPMINPIFKNNFIIELKGGVNDNQAVKTILDKLITTVVIMNTSFKIWEKLDPTNINPIHRFVRVTAKDLNLYLTTIVTKFNNNKDAYAPDTKKKESEQIIFGTTDENLIKFNLYRTIKGIYDKWIGGVDDGNNIIFQTTKIGCDSRNSIDTELAKVRTKKENPMPSLIDSFRFVTRSFKDIGDEFILNPLPVNEFLLNNQNSSFYDIISTLLSANNFDFIALPTYINYNDVDELESMFKPLPYNETINKGVSGPSFVCVYVGQSSKNLDFGGSNYPNDGFDFKCDKGGMLPGIPTDFSTKAKEHENNVAVFAVNFGQQNQNIFKDITLDQSEFSETAESLQIVEDISKKGAETNRTFVGQNIFNVYQTRSYKTEVEMMGNAMIQPMMYFQLNNIPMFHGAYMITRVRHNIKPNYMSTHFTGVRIRKAETPLIDVSVLYMNMLDAMTSTDLGTGTGSKRNFGSLLSNEIPDISVANLFVNPYAGEAVITSAPGFRNLHGNVQNHEGIDFGIQYGTNLVAIYDGTIEKIKYNYNNDSGRGYGLYIVINHGRRGDDKKIYKSVYAHISSLETKIFNLDLSNLSAQQITDIRNGYNPNIKISKGTIFGKSGGVKYKDYLNPTTKQYDLAGGSTGAHLHFELRIGDDDIDYKSITYVNALPYLPVGLEPKFKEFLPPLVNSDIALLSTPNDNQRLNFLGKI